MQWWIIVACCVMDWILWELYVSGTESLWLGCWKREPLKGERLVEFLQKDLRSSLELRESLKKRQEGEEEEQQRRNWDESDSFCLKEFQMIRNRWKGKGHCLYMCIYIYGRFVYNGRSIKNNIVFISNVWLVQKKYLKFYL